MSNRFVHSCPNGPNRDAAHLDLWLWLWGAVPSFSLLKMQPMLLSFYLLWQDSISRWVWPVCRLILSLTIAVHRGKKRGRSKGDWKVGGPNLESFSRIAGAIEKDTYNSRILGVGLKALAEIDIIWLYSNFLNVGWEKFWRQWSR